MPNEVRPTPVTGVDCLARFTPKLLKEELVEEIQAPKVPCRICALEGVDNRLEPKSMTGHLKAHTKGGWTKASYIDRWGEDAKRDFATLTPNDARERADRINAAREEYQKKRALELGLSDESLIYLANPVLEELDDEEKTYYEQTFNLYFQAVDRDEVQIPHVASLVTDIVSLRRLRQAQLKQTKSDKEKAMTRDLEEVIEKTQKRIEQSMKSLHLSREALSKSRDTIKSTAAGLIGGFLDEMSRNTAESLDALWLDVKKVLAQSNDRVKSLVLQYAPELEPEEEEEANSDNTGGIFSFEDALKRAQISL